MRAATSTGSFDVFLVLSPFRTILPELHILLRPLARLTDHLAGVEGYASATRDAALLNLRFDRSLFGRLGVGHLVALFDRLGLVAVVPETMAPADREAFFLTYLAAHDTYAQLYRDADDDLIDRVVDALAGHVAPNRRATSLSGLLAELEAEPTRPRGHRAQRAGSEPAW